MSRISASVQLLVIASIITSVAFVSRACECEVVDVSTHWRYADVVFKGRVVSVATNADNSSNHKKVVLQVSKVYKGTNAESVFTILTPAHGQSCGVGFELGKDYLVFGSKKANLTIEVSRERLSTYTTDQCSGTENWSEDYERQLFGLKQ